MYQALFFPTHAREPGNEEAICRLASPDPEQRVDFGKSTGAILYKRVQVQPECTMAGESESLLLEKAGSGMPDTYWKEAFPAHRAVKSNYLDHCPNDC